jgi:hypothetical protein
VASLTAVGTVQGGGTVIANGENIVVNVTTASGQTAITLPATFGVGDMVFVNVLASDDCLVFPPTGGSIGQAAANSSITVDKGALLIKTTSTLWAAVNSA